MQIIKMPKISLAIVGTVAAAVLISTIQMIKTDSAGENSEIETAVMSQDANHSKQHATDEIHSNIVTHSDRQRQTTPNPGTSANAFNAAMLTSMDDASRRVIGEQISDTYRKSIELSPNHVNSRMSLEDLDNAIFNAINGNLTAQISLSKYLNTCDIYQAARQAEHGETCASIKQILKEYEEQSGEEFSAFEQIENAAIAGDPIARFEYWSVLKSVADNPTNKQINFRARPSEWEQKRNQGLGWLQRLARLGMPEAAMTLALEYEAGEYLDKNLLKAAVYARRAYETNSTNTPQVRKYFEYALEQWAGDEEEFDRLYILLFG